VQAGVKKFLPPDPGGERKRAEKQRNASSRSRNLDPEETKLQEEREKQSRQVVCSRYPESCRNL